FAMTTGWYAVALGPYSAEEAGAALTRLKSDRLIPDDSYVTDGSRFRQRYWPVAGAATLTPEPAIEAAAPAATPDPAPEAAAEPEETQAEARASEAALTQGERELLQTALQWSGHYAGAI